MQEKENCTQSKYGNPTTIDQYKMQKKKETGENYATKISFLNQIYI